MVEGIVRGVDLIIGTDIIDQFVGVSVSEGIVEFAKVVCCAVVVEG